MRSLATAAVALLGLAGCGGGDDDRDAVERYIERANAVQQEFAPAFEDANLTYQQFAEGSMTPREATARLAQAEDAVRSARDELAGVEPPRDAQGLHSRLIRLFDMNLEFAHETALLASYQRGAAQALEPLAAADRRLQAGLDGADDAQQQVRALRRFGATVSRALDALGALEVPAILRPQHGDQVRRLTATQQLTRRLRASLEAEDAEGVARQLKRFRATADDRKPRKRLARRAIEQYTRRYRQLQDAYADLYRNQAQLDRALD